MIAVPAGIVNCGGGASRTTSPFGGDVGATELLKPGAFAGGFEEVAGGRLSWTDVAVVEPLAFEVAAFCVDDLWHPTTHKSAEITVTIARRLGCIVLHHNP